MNASDGVGNRGTLLQPPALTGKLLRQFCHSREQRHSANPLH